MTRGVVRRAARRSACRRWSRSRAGRRWRRSIPRCSRASMRVWTSRGTPRADDRRPLRRGAAPLSIGAHTVCAGGHDAGTATPRALVRLEGADQPVPTRWAGLDLVVRTGATTVTIVGREGTRIQHPRLRFGQRSIDYRHYLLELARKPQACVRSCPISYAISARPFRRSGISCTRRTDLGMRRGSSPRCSASSTLRARTSSCRGRGSHGTVGVLFHARGRSGAAAPGSP